MNVTVYKPDRLAAPPEGFGHAVRIGDWLFISGMSALVTGRGALPRSERPTGVEAQAQEVFDNMEQVLLAAGGSLKSIYEMRIIMRSRTYIPIVLSTLEQRLPERGFICHGYIGSLGHREVKLQIGANAFLGTERVTWVGRR